MKLNALTVITIDYLKSQKIHEVKIGKRLDNTLKIDDVEIDSPIIFNDGLPIGGLYGFGNNSMFLYEIILDKFPDMDPMNEDLVIKTLNSINGKKIQRAKFRVEFLKPLKKWIKNRSIVDKKLGLSLLRHKILGDFDSLSTYLDSKRTYNTLAIAIWRRIKSST